jgi:hypothetical protein
VPPTRRPPGDAPPEDPWEAARVAARSDVAEVLAPRQRTCPACGHVESGPGRVCAACGADLVSRRPGRRWRWRAAAAALLGLALIVAAVAVLTVPARRDARILAERQQASEKALKAAEVRRLRIDARPRQGAGPGRRRGQDAIGHRRELVATVERLITRDARARVRAGTMKGPIAGTDCAPYPDISDRRQAEADPAAAIGRYDCVAYSNRVDLPELGGKRRRGLFGVPFWAVIDYRRATIVWCKVTPTVGEGGRPLASVPVPPPCRDPLRRSR